MQREIIIVQNTIYSVIRKYHKFLKKEVTKLEPMEDLPSGLFPVSEYMARLYIEDSAVKFIELFAEIPKSARDEFVSEIRDSLKDLTRLGN